MSGHSFEIKTSINKSAGDPEVLEFEVECATAIFHDEPPEEPRVVIGRLTGFLVELGHLPTKHEDQYFDLFDARTSHSAEAFVVLHRQRALIGKALPNSQLLEFGSAVVLLERIWVRPQYRGKGLALRLMREAQHVLGRYGLLVMLKAHPDGDGIKERDLLRLADYYASDRQLALKHLSRSLFPGWLVGHWGAQHAPEGDHLHWEPDV